MFEHISPQILMLGGLALAALVLLRKLRSLTSERSDKPSSAKRSMSLPSDSRQDHRSLEPPIEVIQWQVELHQTARELKAEIDSKIVALQAVTRLAREEQRRLEASIQRARGTSLGSPSDHSKEPGPDALELIQRLADGTASPGDLPPVAPQPTSIPQLATIHSLARSGQVAPQIARQLSLPLGEVELALSLSQPKAG